MDRTREGALRPPATPPPPVTPQPLRVTPDNVVELALLFENVSATLTKELQVLGHDLQLSEPWMADPASGWMSDFFHRYFLDDENSFSNFLEALRVQHEAHAVALGVAATHYGKTEELNAARAARTEELLGEPPR